MLIDDVLDRLDVTVEPFAVCVVSSGWRLRVPTVDHATIHFVLRGHGALRLAGGATRPLRPYTLVVVPERRGHALLVPPTPGNEVRVGRPAAGVDGLPEHVAGIEGDRELLVACGRVEVRYAGALPLFGPLERPLVIDFSDVEGVTAIFRAILAESTARSPGHVAMLRALMGQCLVLLLRRLAARPDDAPSWLRAIGDARMAPVLAAVHRDPGHPHTVASLAAVANLSRSAFAAAFVRRFGLTPMAFVRDVRLRRAAELLRTSPLDVATIARRVGFASRSHFSRTFREVFGEPPAAHRTTHAPT